MSRVLLSDIEGHRETFEDIHEDKQYYGSSDVASVVGLNPFWTPLQEWCVRTGRTKREDISKKISVRVGRAAEPVLGELFVERHGGSIHSANKILQHNTFDWAIASPDFYWDNHIVEAKNVGSWARDEWSDEQAPDYYLIQLQWQLGIDNEASDEAYFSAIVGGSQHFTPKFLRSKEVFEQLTEQVTKFRMLVDADTPPDAKAGDDKVISELCKPTTDECVYLDFSEHGKQIEDYLGLKEELDKAKEPVKALEKRIKEIELNIRLRMGEHSRGACGQWGLEVQRKEIVENKPRRYWRESFKVYEVI